MSGTRPVGTGAGDTALAALGVDGEAEAVYRVMLRAPDLDADGIAERVGRRAAAVRAAQDRLVARGLARRTSSRRRPVRALPPSTVLPRLLADELRRIEDHRTGLQVAAASLPVLAADHLAGQSPRPRAADVVRMTEEEVFAFAEELQRTTTGEVLSLHPATAIDVDPPSYIELMTRQLQGGRSMRALYPVDVVTDEHRLRYVRRWAAAGERVRLLPDLPPTLAVFGDGAALAAASWGGAGQTGTYLIRVPALIGALRALFDQLWARAAPLPRSSVEGGTAEEVLRLLALGLKDEAIARQLGVSLRTVRRRVTEVMDDVGASTRFQAGMAAARRGLV